MLTFFSFFGLYTEFGHVYQEAHSNIQYLIYFVFCLLLIWGGLVANNICHVTYCGVFGRWYHGKDDQNKVRASLATALTTSFGSICLGSFFIAVVRALEMMVRKARQDAARSGNYVTCVLLCILECLISIIGDVLEYFSEWSYVQVAVRGCSFCDSVRITMGLCTCVNLVYIIQDLLLDSVVSLGALICGVVGGLVGAVMGAAYGGTLKIVIGAFVGLLAACVSGCTAISVISSGVKTVLVLWAEDPTGLEKARPQVAAKLHDKMMEHW